MPAAKQPVSRAPMWSWVILVVILTFVAFVRLRLADMPLERDEGEYSYAGQLILQGIPPYKLAYNMKLPGSYAMYGVLMAVFGETPRGIHLGLLFVNAATIILLFSLGRKLLGTKGGLIAAATFALLSTSHAFLALAAHANHFVILFAVAGLLLLLIAQETKRTLLFFATGLLFGLAFLMKQQGVVFIFFGGLALVAHALKIRPVPWKNLARSLCLYTAGAALPFGVTCLSLWLAGVFPKFWFWTFQYAKEYASAVPTSEIWPIFSQSFSAVLRFTWTFWIFGVAGLGMFLTINSRRRQGLWLILLFLLSALGVSIGFYFRPHYFILALPALSLAMAGFVCLGTEMFPAKSVFRWIPMGVFLACVAHFLYAHAQVFFQVSGQQLATALYQGNPFTKMEAVANFIRQNSSPEDRVAVIGSEPELYFLSHRRSATGYIYTYGLMEPHPFALQMQKEMIQEIESNAPKFLVMVDFQFSWLTRPNSSSLIFDWLTKYSTEHYKPVGLLDFQSPTQVDEYWNPNGIANSPRSTEFVVVFQRVDATPK